MHQGSRSKLEHGGDDQRGKVDRQHEWVFSHLQDNDGWPPPVPKPANTPAATASVRAMRCPSMPVSSEHRMFSRRFLCCGGPLMTRTSALPKRLQPMLATLTDRPFDDSNWVFEDKFDGFR